MARVCDVPAWRRALRGSAAHVLRWRAERFAPDFILCTRHAAPVSAALERLLARVPSAFWYFDAVAPLPDEAVLLARRCAHTYTTYGFQLEAFHAAGCREVRYLPQGMDPVVDRPAARAPADYRCDLSFVGSGQYSRRHALLRTLAGSFGLQIRGPGWHDGPSDLPVAGGVVRPTDFPRVVRGASLSLGIDALPHPPDPGPRGTSNRLWRVLGAEGCFLGEYVPGVEALARHGVEALWYRSPAEAVDLAREFLAEPGRAAAIARAGRAHVLARHTYAHRVRMMLAGQDYIST